MISMRSDYASANKTTNTSAERKMSTSPKVMALLRSNRVFQSLHADDRMALEKLASTYRLTYQQAKQICDWALDLRCWEEKPLVELLRAKDADFSSGEAFFRFFRNHWNTLKTRPKNYQNFQGMVLVHGLGDEKPAQQLILDQTKEGLALGSCPVASPRTRCCNLQTLDVIEGCGFDCSYCAIKTFYQPGQVSFDRSFAEKLAKLELPKDKLYHIGTGQSSDSLLWANRWGALDALVDFAHRHPKVILELKTKSKNIEPLLDRDLPPNLVCTWSLNTPVLIEKEEHRTASLEQRLEAARKLSEKGGLVGFHFHPLVDYDRWEQDYQSLCDQLIGEFSPEQVLMVSLGTLTFTRPVMKRLRTSLYRSKILQMPLVEAEGKFSYPLDVKRRLFSQVYRWLESWHEKVYFYLCMEDQSLWMDVFSREYPTNEDFEQDMLNSYWEKICLRHGVKQGINP